MNIDYALSRERRPDFRYRLKRRTREVLQVIGRHKPSPQNIVDLGTAEGRMLKEVKQRHPSSWCLGIDYSLPLLLYGRERNADLALVCGDIKNLGFLKNETFDLIIAAAVIEHLVSPQDMLRESVRLLRDEGILIITTPHPFWEKVSAALGWIKGDHHSVMAAGNLSDLCRKERLLILEDYGFMISPVGLWGENCVEAVLRWVGIDRFLPNHLLVTQKSKKETGLKDGENAIPR